ncbi:hypothetical protein ABT033_24680 [Streptomyces pharetrae]|uniref:hypothetical protein n=1 Tax=Streptomyces pharetrae TaxID=291370 RepID=UPI00335C1D62
MLGTVWNGDSGQGPNSKQIKGVQVIEVRPSQPMRDLGVVQHGVGIPTEPARPFDLPAERDQAERIVDELFAAIERIGQVHPFAKGMDIAAPQIGFARAAAVVLPPDGSPTVILLNLAFGLAKGELSPKDVTDRLSMTVAARTPEETHFLSVAASYSEWISPDEIPGWETDLRTAAHSLTAATDRGSRIGVPGSRHD